MTQELKKIVVVGAGGIGGTVAAFLARAGEKVTVVDKSVPHIEAIRARGLLVDGVFGELRPTFEQTLFPEELKSPLDISDSGHSSSFGGSA